MKFLLIVLSVLFIFSTSMAAPIPATSSSFFLRTDLGLFRSNMGFSIHAGKTSWTHQEVPKNQPSIVTLYKSPKTNEGVQPTLSVRLDELSKPSSLKKYINKWKKEYPRFGFTILNSQAVKLTAGRAHLLDSYHPQTEKQMRQIVLIKDKRAVVLTCRDHRSGFKETVKECNQIFRNFRWL